MKHDITSSFANEIKRLLTKIQLNHILANKYNKANMSGKKNDSLNHQKEEQSINNGMLNTPVT